jgi:hypothetical protein
VRKNEKRRDCTELIPLKTIAQIYLKDGGWMGYCIPGKKIEWLEIIALFAGSGRHV